jgi:predicted O-linked N-acetylglucosamine transferase (SPINDLY family)
MGNLPLGAECASALLRQFPDDLDVRLSSAGFLIDDGAPVEALSVLPPVTDGVADDVRVLKLYARAHAKMDQWEAALSYSMPAVALAPADVQALFWHGIVLSHTNDAESALVFLNRALILDPENVEAAYNAGVILYELGNSRDAETVFRRALRATPMRVADAARFSAHLRLLQLLWMQGRHGEWISEGRKFASGYPGVGRSRLIESRIARDGGQLELEAEILQPLAEESTLLKDDLEAFELIGEILATLCYHDVPEQLLLRLATRFRDAARVLYPALDVRPTGMARAQLHVGYLVDFVQPFIADFMVILIGHHDPKRVNVKVYAISPIEPAVRDALLAGGAQLISVATFDERRAAQRIRADGLDILIDIAAFGPYAKPGLLSCRPARVQLALPGFTHPFGIGELDFRLSDQVADLDAGSIPDVPARIFLDCGVFPLLPVPHTRLQVTRAQLGIGEDVEVFGVLAPAVRLSSRCITTWKALADRVPTALFFVCPLQAADREQIRRLLVAGGIASARILMLPASESRARDIALTGLVDVILDTMPGSDYFSARAAIHDAIPLVTIPGRMFEERVALSLLTHLGDCSSVAASGRDYVDLAAQLAVHVNLSPTARAANTDRRRALLETAAMANMNQYVAHFENALFRAVASAALPEMTL